MNTMSTKINMALDEIIVNRRSGGGGARRGGAIGGARRNSGRRINPRNDLFTSEAPAGKWKHDKFGEIYGGKRRSAGTSRATANPRGARSGGGNIVKLNISNLPASVVTADLEELFQDFGVYGVSVHYDEVGQHLGTADLFVDIGSAKDIMREYANIAIDGQTIKFAVVDETGKALGGRASIAERVQIRRVARRSDPIRRRREQVATKKRTPGGAVGGGGGRGRRGPATEKKPAKKELTSDELDKQLEAYMGSRHPAIQQP